MTNDMLLGGLMILTMVAGIVIALTSKRAPEIATKIVADRGSSAAVPIYTEKGSARQAEPFLVL